MEQEMAGLASPSTPATTDACGCMPGSASAAESPTAADQTSEHPTMTETAAATESPRRSLKLVVTLTPAEAGQYRATLALGADNCDPILRSITVMELSDALNQVQSLQREAEASWQAHPRNPTAARAPMPRSDANKRRPVRLTTSPADESAPTPTPDIPPDAIPPALGSTDDVVKPKPTGGGQLTLFG
jgi:hypothetical protein